MAVEKIKTLEFIQDRGILVYRDIYKDGLYTAILPVNKGISSDGESLFPYNDIEIIGACNNCYGMMLVNFKLKNTNQQ